MTNVRLTDGTTISCESVELVNGVLCIKTAEKTVEELAGLFSDAEKTCKILLLTESGEETGYKEGFISFAGINYDAGGSKTIEMLHMEQTEKRIENLEAKVETLESQIGAYVTEQEPESVEVDEEPAEEEPTEQ